MIPKYDSILVVDDESDVFGRETGYCYFFYKLYIAVNKAIATYCELAYIPVARCGNCH